MISAFLNTFRIPELRRKILVTLGLCVVYRIGAHVPTPFINPQALNEYFDTMTGGMTGQGIFAVVDMFSGRAFRQMTIFALGIMPYISVSIILQILQVVWPKLEKISKEGEAGRKKINQWTRYGTVILGFFQGFGLGYYLYNNQLTVLQDHPVILILTTAVTMTAGTCFVMWLGEKITEHGIGNGISIIIAIGIVAAYPSQLATGFSQAANQLMSWPSFIGVLALMLVFSGLTILTQQASRKIPVQHARRVVGRKISQGGTTHLPLKLNTAGVIPVIFTSSLLSFPQLFVGFMPADFGQTFLNWIGPSSPHNLYEALGLRQGGIFNLLKIANFHTFAYIVLTAAFCYFYTAVTFNPVDLADNLKKSGAFIPGKKPGKETSNYINYILVRITVVGAAFLIAIALVPDVLAVSFDIPYQYAQLSGGTGLIIVVGVFLDTMKQIESQLLMRHYEGFRYRGAGGGAAALRRRTRR